MIELGAGRAAGATCIVRLSRSRPWAVSALSGGTNWLMTNYPDVYLFGTLAEAYGFIGDFDKASMWAARRDAVFDEIDKLDFATKLPSGIRTEMVVV